METTDIFQKTFGLEEKILFIFLLPLTAFNLLPMEYLETKFLGEIKNSSSTSSMFNKISATDRVSFGIPDLPRAA
jgi:hypothetical protein